MTIDMLRGPLWNRIILFAIPLALTAFLQQLFNTADVFFLGNYVGKEAMAAVGNNTPFIGLLVNLFVGLSIGANVLVAQKIGGRDLLAAKRAIHTAMPLAIATGILLMVVAEPLVPWVLDRLGVPPDLREMSELYMRIYLLSIPFTAIYNFEAAIFRSIGDTTTPLWGLAAGTVTNIVLNMLWVDSWGVAGIAWATVIAYAVCSGLLLVCLLRHKGVIRLDVRNLQLHRPSLRFIMRIGMPAGIQGMVFSLSNLVIQSAINSLGPDAMAASAAAFTIEINVYCVLMAFGQAATTFVGQNYGAGNIRRCIRVTWTSIGLSAVFMETTILVILHWDTYFLSFFNTDPNVISLGATRLLYICGPQIGNSLMEGFSGTLRGYGISLPPAILMLLGVCGVRIVWVYTVFQKSHTFETLMSCYFVSWTATTILLFIFYAYVIRHIKRQGRNPAAKDR